jgi:hypothetical protein
VFDPDARLHVATPRQLPQSTDRETAGRLAANCQPLSDRRYF